MHSKVKSRKRREKDNSMNTNRTVAGFFKTLHQVHDTPQTTEKQKL
jgi:hypothetical protein